MGKITLHNEDEWQSFCHRFRHVMRYPEIRDKPKQYPCVVVWDEYEDEICEQFFYELVYQNDFV